MDPGLRSICLDILRGARIRTSSGRQCTRPKCLNRAGNSGEVRRTLAPRLAAETDAQRRCGLARELVRAGDLSRTTLLFQVLSAPDPYGHVHAAESLYKLGQPDDGGVLRVAMESGETAKLQLMAAGALAAGGDPMARKFIRDRLLQPEDTEARRTAAWLLARLGDNSDIPTLSKCAGSESDLVTKAYLENALASLGNSAGLAALRRIYTTAMPRFGPIPPKPSATPAPSNLPTGFSNCWPMQCSTFACAPRSRSSC